jgi:hypothetical protein
MNVKRSWVMLFALFAAAALFPSRLAAQTQTSGDVTGVVSDPSGATVPQARVTLVDRSKGSHQETQTNKDGVYHFFLLAPGDYTLTVNTSGFQPATVGSEVRVGQITNTNIQLALASASQTVTVTEAAPLVQTDNGNTATTLNEQQVSQLPNPGNDLSYIAQMAPGSLMNTQSGFGNFSSFGISATSNLFTLNGMDDNDPFLNLNNSGATNLLLGQNEVQEATVVQNGYSGQYGGLAGANVNYITKSGSNDWHGNAIYYWNGRALNANDYFNNEHGTNRPFSNANQWAGSFGGPIKRDKAFFFFNTEGLRVVLPSTFTVQVPTQAFEAATIANLNAQGLAGSVPFYNNMFSLYNGSIGGHSLAPKACPANPAGDIPGGFCTDQFQSAVTNLTHEYQISGRADYNIGANDRAFLRVEYDRGIQAAATDPINPIFNITSDQPQWQGQLVENHVLGATATNQLILSGTWYSALFDNANRSATLQAFPTTLLLADGTLTNLGGQAAGGLGNAAFPQGRNVTQYEVNDDVSKTWGRHSISFGGKFRRNDVSDHDFGAFSSGFLVVNSLQNFFNGGSTGDSLINAFPTSLNQPIALYSVAGYVQDEWRVKPNLTFTVALRVEHDSNPICQRLCFGRLDTPFVGAEHDPNVPFNQALLVNQKQDLSGLDNILWQPRISFAWQPFGATRNTVLRGGIGIFNDAFPGVLTDSFASNPPLLNTFIVANDNLAPTQGSNVFADAAALNNAFTTGFLTGQTVAQIKAGLPAQLQAFFVPPNLFSSDQQSRIPQYQKWSLEIQQGIGQSTSFSLGYIGNHGTHELIQNAAVNAFGFGSLPVSSPDPRFGTVTQYQNGGVSNFNGVTATFQHRFSRWNKGQFSANYTYGHAFDVSSNGGITNTPFAPGSSLSTPQDPNNIRGNYGPADYDVRHNFNANYVWEVPLRTLFRGHGPSQLVEGWQVSGTVFARSGLPYSVIDSGLDAALAGNNFGSAVLPQFLGGSTSNCGKGATAVNPITPCLTTTQFVPAGSETAFTSGLRNIFRGPSYFNTDFTIMKNTKIPGWERGELGLGFQFFNLFNHPNFNVPDNSISHGSPAQGGTFGQIFSTVSAPTSILGSFLGGDASPRLIQVKAQLRF